MRSFSITLVLGISILTSAQDLPTHLGDQVSYANFLGECKRAYQCISGVCEGNSARVGTVSYQRMQDQYSKGSARSPSSRQAQTGASRKFPSEMVPSEIVHPRFHVLPWAVSNLLSAAPPFTYLHLTFDNWLSVIYPVA
ncbi:uncharacterized protein RAG0_13749 [Rhynchosporium agropyri]|uniref:Uncharacterized protein n=1 Tax=Rhynchosporium agropyri TaxID=914238 RepID=A0A1E1LE37_9HELO|nr:uncharacterized protein RAG0_13749 [Rhynchosporium agropyri]